MTPERIREALVRLAGCVEHSILDPDLLPSTEWWLVKDGAPCPCKGTGRIDVKFGSTVIDVRPCPRGCSIPH